VKPAYEVHHTAGMSCSAVSNFPARGNSRKE
jgi:hypothetical protein